MLRLDGLALDRNSDDDDDDDDRPRNTGDRSCWKTRKDAMSRLGDGAFSDSKSGSNIPVVALRGRHEE